MSVATKANEEPMLSILRNNDFQLRSSTASLHFQLTERLLIFEFFNSRLCASLCTWSISMDSFFLCGYLLTSRIVDDTVLLGRLYRPQEPRKFRSALWIRTFRQPLWRRNSDANSYGKGVGPKHQSWGSRKITLGLPQ